MNAEYVINTALDNYSCGLELIKLLNIKVSEAYQEIEAIKAEAGRLWPNKLNVWYRMPNSNA